VYLNRGHHDIPCQRPLFRRRIPAGDTDKKLKAEGVFRFVKPGFFQIYQLLSAAVIQTGGIYAFHASFLVYKGLLPALLAIAERRFRLRIISVGLCICFYGHFLLHETDMWKIIGKYMTELSNQRWDKFSTSRREKTWLGIYLFKFIRKECGVIEVSEHCRYKSAERKNNPSNMKIAKMLYEQEKKTDVMLPNEEESIEDQEIKTPARNEIQVGRNAPCPCGSGKK
jgi:hypothetical protein